MGFAKQQQLLYLVCITIKESNILTRFRIGFSKSGVIEAFTKLRKEGHKIVKLSQKLAENENLIFKLIFTLILIFDLI